MTGFQSFILTHSQKWQLFVNLVLNYDKTRQDNDERLRRVQRRAWSSAGTILTGASIAQVCAFGPQQFDLPV
jgi:hypothetical protein